MSKHPMQPVELVRGVIRFKQNRIVHDYHNFAAHKSGVVGIETPFDRFDMNMVVKLLQEGRYTVEEYEQYCQLIGYSVSGFGDLHFVRPETVQKADDEAEALMMRIKLGTEYDTRD